MLIHIPVTIGPVVIADIQVLCAIDSSIWYISGDATIVVRQWLSVVALSLELPELVVGGRGGCYSRTTLALRVVAAVVVNL